MTPYDLSNAAALDRLLDAIERGDHLPVGWTALPPDFADEPIPAGVGCYYRTGPEGGWMKLNVAEWVWFRLICCEGEYVRRVRA